MATALLSFEENFVDPRLARSLWFMSGLVTVHADASDTNGGFALLEISGKPGNEPPLHVHQHEDELFYVVEGRLVVTRGSETLVLEAGDSGFLPRGVPHTFKIRSAHVRFLVYVSPAGFEEYFRTLGQPAEYLAPQENSAPTDVQRLLNVGERFGLTFLL